MVAGVNYTGGGADIDIARPDNQAKDFSVAYGSWSDAITTTKKPRYIAVTFDRANVGDGSVWLVDTKNETAWQIGYNGSFRYTSVAFSDIIQIVSDTAFKVKGQGGATFTYQAVWWYE